MGLWRNIKAVVTFGGSIELEKAQIEYQNVYQKYSVLHAITLKIQKECKAEVENLGRITQKSMKLLKKTYRLLEKYASIRGGAEDFNTSNYETFTPNSLPLISQLNTDFSEAFAIAKGTGAGTATVAGSWALVSLLGAASTGTAINTLSGAAATNAILAWFGGGSLAVGGAGMAGGTIVLGALAVVPMLIVSVYSTYSKASKVRKATTELQNKYIPEVISERENLERFLISIRFATQKVAEQQQILDSQLHTAKKSIHPRGMFSFVVTFYRWLAGNRCMSEHLLEQLIKLDNAALNMYQLLAKERTSSPFCQLPQQGVTTSKQLIFGGSGTPLVQKNNLQLLLLKFYGFNQIVTSFKRISVVLLLLLLVCILVYFTYAEFIFKPQESRTTIESEHLRQNRVSSVALTAEPSIELALQKPHNFDAYGMLGNTWVYHLERKGGDGIDEASVYSFFVKRTIKKITEGELGKIVVLLRIGGVYNPKKLEYKFKNDCIYRTKKKGVEVAIWCMDGAVETSLEIMGKQIPVWRFDSNGGKLKTFFSPELGIVRWIQEQKNGRVVTSTLWGYKVGLKEVGNWENDPVQCDWNRVKSFKRNAKQLSEMTVQDTLQHRLAIDAQLEYEETSFVEFRLKGNGQASIVLLLSDGRRTLLAFCDRDDEVVWSKEVSGDVKWMKRFYDKAGQSELLAVGAVGEGEFSVHFYNYKDDNVRTLKSVLKYDPNAKYDFHLMAGEDACYGRFWKKEHAGIICADVFLDWDRHSVLKKRGSLTFQ